MLLHAYKHEDVLTESLPCLGSGVVLCAFHVAFRPTPDLCLDSFDYLGTICVLHAVMPAVSEEFVDGRLPCSALYAGLTISDFLRLLEVFDRVLLETFVTCSSSRVLSRLRRGM